MTPLQAVLRKELHEGLKWGVAGAIGATVMMWLAVATQTSVMSGVVPGIGNGPFMIATIAAGLIMGLGQSLPEHRGDKWAFLTHRPVTRSTLFAARITAGILLYLLATGVPFAWVMWKLATPGHEPMPFDIRMTQPGLADLLCGVVYYFAALLTGMRQARWYASRTMAIGAAMLCTLGVVTAIEFWQAIVVAVVGIAVVGTAARATFLAGGEYSPQPKLGRVTLAASLLPGIAVVGGIALMIGSGLLTVGKSDTRDITSVDYQVTSDGRLVKATSVYHLFAASNGPEITDVRDLDGKPVARYATDSARRNLVAGVIESSQLQLVEPPGPRPGASYRDIQRLFVRLIPHGEYSAPVAWYYVHRLGRIVGYDIVSSRPLGWLGPDGFASTPSGRPFTAPLLLRPDNAFATSRLAFPDAVFRLELKTKRVVKIFSAAPGETILGTVEASGGRDFPFSMEGTSEVTHTDVIIGGVRRFQAQTDSTRRSDSSFTAIATTKGIYVLRGDDTPLLAVPHDPRAAGYGVVDVMRAIRAPGKPIFVSYKPYGGTLPEKQWWSLPAQVAKYDSTSATPIEHLSLPPIGRPGMVPTDWVQTIITETSTPVILPIVGAMKQRVTNSPLSEPRPASAWAIALVAAGLFAVGAFAIGRRYAFTGRQLLLWTTIGFLGGALGVLLLLAIREWPAREPCASCGQMRVVSRIHCEHCGAAFQPPALDGTEVFEPA